MVETTCSPAVRDRYDRFRAGRRHQPRRSHGTAFVLSTVAIAAAAGYVTFSLPGVVADARSGAMTTIQAFLGPWLETVRRALVEDAANVLLFLPVGVLASLALTRRSRLPPLLVDAGLSVAVESVQSGLSGRVSYLVDAAAHTARTALGVWLVALTQALTRFRGPRVRRRGGLRAGLLIVPVLVALAACQPAGGSSSSLPTAANASTATTRAAGAMTAADGWLPQGQSLSPFADVPAITKLNPALRRAVQDAAQDATLDGLNLHISSGWRSAAYQQALFDAAVAEHGSEQAASKYVLPPSRSDHVAGRAVDIGPTDAMSWMAQHGSHYGLCQTYGNEMWHFELTVAPGGTCPPPTPDASAG